MILLSYLSIRGLLGLWEWVLSWLVYLQVYSASSNSEGSLRSVKYIIYSSGLKLCRLDVRSVAGSDVIQEVYRIGTNDRVFSTHIAGPNTLAGISLRSGQDSQGQSRVLRLM